MSLLNVTFDDFDPVLVYSNPADWMTPNPQDTPSWFNASSDVTGSVWHQATYHSTAVQGSKVSFNFTGTGLYVYGGLGSGSANYSMTIDPSLSSPIVYVPSGEDVTSKSAASNERSILYQTNDLAYAQHEAVFETLGGNVTLDLVVVTGLEFGASGSTLTNTTLDDPSSLIKYSGSWTTNQNPLFSGGSSIYTSTPGDSFSFDFEGSAFYIYGDQVNDHGVFSVFLNDTALTSGVLSGRSGCGGDQAKSCEKLDGLHFFHGGLGQGVHRVRVVNDGSGRDAPYFDLDRVIYTTPSVYSTRQFVRNLTCPYANCTDSTQPTTTSSGAASPGPTSSQTGASSRLKIPSIFRPLVMIRNILLWDIWRSNVNAEAFITDNAGQDQWRPLNETNGASEEDGRRHTNNWAVLVCTSRYWFNYRHMANTLGMYRTVKRLGIPDSRIILMLADDVACNPRNGFPATIYANSGRQLDLYGSGVDSKKTGEDGAVGVEVDYRGYEVNVESFLRVLTGRYDDSLPASKRLLSDSSSNVFIYMAGHGGDEFLKFQDNEEVGAHDIGDAIGQMWEKRRYNKLFFMTDTCQANTLYKHIYSPNVLATGSSELGENSYSHHNDHDIGVAVIDSYTHYVLQYLEGIDIGSNVTMKDFFDHYDPVKIKSHPGVFTEYFPDDLAEVLVTDFFGGVSRAEGVEKVEMMAGQKIASGLQSGQKVEERARKALTRERLPTRQGYLMQSSPRPSESIVGLGSGWTQWLALMGLAGLGGVAWMTSS